MPGNATVVCVQPPGVVRSSNFDVSFCDAGIVEDLAGALAVAAALPDDPSGQRPNVGVVYVPADAPYLVPLPAETTIDQATGGYGCPLFIGFGGNTLCPIGATEPTAPVFRVVAADPVVFTDFILDFTDEGACPSLPRPVLAAVGSGRVGVERSHIRGWHGTAIRGTSSGDLLSLGINDSRFDGGLGGIASVSGSVLSFDGSDVVGNVLPDDGTPAFIESRDPEGLLDVNRSSFVGNRLEPSANSRALVIGGRHHVSSCSFVGNLLAPADSVLRVGYGSAPWARRNGQVDLEEDGITANLFQENRATTELGLAPYAGSFPALGPPGRGACEDVRTDWVPGDQPSPWPASTEVHPLHALSIDPSLGRAIDGGVYLGRNTFVGNRLGDAALVFADTIGANLWVQLLHNTFADQASAAAIEVRDPAGGGVEVVAVGNLWLDQAGPDAHELIRVPSQLRTLVSTANGAPDPDRWSPSGSATHQLAGANHTWTELPLRPVEPGLSPCERHVRLCPDRDLATCEQEAGPNNPVTCGAGLALDLIPAPTEEFFFPWTSGHFDTVPSFGLGVSGGACGSGFGTFDSHPLGSGDGDGFPTIVDCDNEDASVVPRLPTADGYREEACDGADGVCFACPPWATDVSADDDDSGADDDSAGGPSVGLPPPNAGATAIEPGCVDACGFNWAPSPAAFLFGLVPLMSRRRRGAGASAPPARRPWARRAHRRCARRRTEAPLTPPASPARPHRAGSRRPPRPPG